MIIGHMPAGYITARLLLERARSHGVAGAHFVFASIAGAIAPDFDLAYFYLVDGRQHHHHTYVTHYPVLWAVAILACALWWRTGKSRRWALLAGIFALCGFAHMLLDSVVGDIAWLAPFDDRFFSLFVVPAVYEIWWFNFILHWSFVLEIAVVASAVALWRRDRGRYQGAQILKSSKGRAS